MEDDRKFNPDTSISKEVQALADEIFGITKGKPVKVVEKALGVVRDEVYRMTEPEHGMCGMMMAKPMKAAEKLKKGLSEVKKKQGK